MKINISKKQVIPMFRYFFRRTLYSILILLGVILVSFLLFNVAAGDPAAAALGKNARPAEIESLRRELGADLPLFWGYRCTTEAYPSLDAAQPLPPGIRLQPDGKFLVKRTFSAADIEVEVTQKNGKKTVLPCRDETLTFPADTAEAHFFRRQSNPLHSQFTNALKEVVTIVPQPPYLKVLDFGRTITTREPIREILARGVWPSLGLMIPVFLGELAFGLLFATIAIAFQDRWVDRALLVLSILGISVSYLVVIIFAQWFLGYRCGWFPLWGWESWQNLLLPVTVGVLCGIGSNVRFYRTVLANELHKEYLRTAAAKGVSSAGVYGRHLLRNAALQIITRAGASLPYLFTGSLLLESFFGIPGLGFAGVEALYNSDLQLLKAIVVTSALLFIVINFLTDLAYAWADPRVRLE